MVLINEVFIWLFLICVVFEEVVKFFIVIVLIVEIMVEMCVLLRFECIVELCILLDVEGMVELCILFDLDDVWLNNIDFVVEFKVFVSVVGKKVVMVVLIVWGEVWEVKMVEGGMYLESLKKFELDRL